MPNPNPNTVTRKPAPAGRAPTARELVAAKGTRATPANAAAAKAPATAVAVRKPTPVVEKAPDTRPYLDRYLDEVSPTTMGVGRRVKFSKDDVFVTTDDEQELPPDAEYVVLADQSLSGWLKFNGPGQPPDNRMGLTYEPGFTMVERGELGDGYFRGDDGTWQVDASEWELGLDGKPDDPWKHHMYLVLQDTATSELYTFTTSSPTGRNAVGRLLKHYNRMLRSHPDTYPVIRLRTGGFNHRDERVGWVTVPLFLVCGRAPTDSAAKPDTSVGTFIDDEIK
jgi:hypothetical protein